jgi:pilus assembly protein Flp/PilA
MRLVRRLIDAWGNEQGQGLVEYALILVLIAIVAIVALVFIGNQVSTELSKVGASV